MVGTLPNSSVENGTFSTVPAEKRCSFLHGLPCLAHRDVIAGILSPCTNCSQGWDYCMSSLFGNDWKNGVAVNAYLNRGRSETGENELCPMPQPLKVISLTQPWASLVVAGHKQNETRSWTTTHRGKLLIHASKGFPSWARELCTTEPFVSTLREMGYLSWQSLPTGAILGGCDLVSIVSTNGSLAFAGMSERQRSIEAPFGDYSPDIYAWRLGGSWQLAEPVPCRGALSLWQAPESVVNAIEGKIQ